MKRVQFEQQISYQFLKKDRVPLTLEDIGSTFLYHGKFSSNSQRSMCEFCRRTQATGYLLLIHCQVLETAERNKQLGSS